MRASRRENAREGMGHRSLIDASFSGLKTISRYGKEEKMMGFTFGHNDAAVEPRVAVIGVGGAGCNVVSDVYWDYPSVDTIAVNTDKDALNGTDADSRLFICRAVTQGQGTNGDSMLGKRCAQAHIEEITEALSGHDIVFVVAGMGGGTGSGAAPVIADIAQRMNCIVFSILINPFGFETARTKTAREAISHVKAVCPMTVVIENDLVLEKLPNMTANEAFASVNKSIVSFIQKQHGKVISSFKLQLGRIGEFVKSDDMLPKTMPSNGVVVN
jgi:cell division protein FtsZ